MKILIISNLFPPGFIGGYELGALDIARALHQRGHDIHVLTSNYFLDDEKELDSLKVSRSLHYTDFTHEIADKSAIKNYCYNFHNLRIIGGVIRQFQPQVVIAFNLIGLGVASIIQYLQAISMPTIVYLMDNIFYDINSRYLNLFGQFQLNQWVHFIAMSENITDEIYRMTGMILKNITYIPGWVDFQQIKVAKINFERKEIVRFVFCSQVVAHKGIDIVIEAAEQLIQQGHTKFLIDVYGGGQIANFLQKIKAKNLDKHLFYKGVYSKIEILSILANYEALLFPTLEREPFGFVASEAAAVGCFPIMTASIGASEWFIDQYDCLKIPRDSLALSSAMLQVMSWSDVEMKKKRLKTMMSARKNFEFAKWVAVIEKKCQEMAALQPPKNYVCSPKAAESAFLFLSTLLNESIVSATN